MEFYARIFGYEDPGEAGPFGTVRVNDTFNLDIQDTEDFNSIHYAFAMDVEEFEATFSTIKKAGIPYGDGPRTQESRKSPGRTNGTKCKGPKIYFKDLRGQVLEIKTY